MSATVDIFRKDVGALVRISSPPAVAASLLDFVAVVDVSGSMGAEQSIVTNAGRESHGFSTLDIVKHALKVKVNMLSAMDRFGLVAYDSTAEIIFPLTLMTEDVRGKCLAAIDRLIPLRSTNIFDGLEKAFQCFGVGTRIRSILLYTDGVNNAGPAEGPLEALKNYIRRLGLPAQVSINGFGIETDPLLMRQLADVGQGVYFFTPDAGMIGTTSVNYMANLSVTVATKVELQVGASVIPVGALLAGQPSYVYVDETEGLKLNIPYTIGSGTWTPEEVAREEARHELITALGSVLSTAYDLPAARTILMTLAKKSQPSDLFTDLTGEIMMAVKDNDTFQRWGKNYLLAMETAHRNGKQTNFKDVSLRGYTSPFRETIKNKGNAIFDTMPAPNRSAVSCRSQAAPTTMASYNNDSDPCMIGDATVLTSNGSMRVDELSKGTVLPDGAIVICVVKTLTTASLVDVGATGTPWITPYHPILYKNEWRFPVDLAPSIAIASLPIYSFVLSGGFVLNINGFDCISLGHGLNAPVAAHPYLGTDKILQDLARMPGYEEGLVTLQSNSMRREDNVIVGMNF